MLLEGNSQLSVMVWPTIMSSLSDYSDAYIHVKGTITIPNMAVAGVAANNANNT